MTATTSPVATQLEDPSGKLLQERKQEASGQFGFTTTAEGDYKACFMVKGVSSATILQVSKFSKLKINIAAKKQSCPLHRHLTTDYSTAQQTRIWVDWKTGVHARDWDALAKKENLNAMAAELNKLEETVKDILQEMAYLRRREEEMRNINGARGCTRVVSACCGFLKGSGRCYCTLHNIKNVPMSDIPQRQQTAGWRGFRWAPCLSASRWRCGSCGF